MSSRVPCCVVLIAALFVTTLPAEAAAFRQKDYAYSATLRVAGPGPAYVASLPLHVYRSVTRTDLSDICVVNASGEVVPFAVRRPESPRARHPEPVKLPLFEVRDLTEVSGEALRLRVRQGETAVDIDRPAAAAGSDRPSSYLIDARTMQQPITALRIGWDAASADFSGRLQIDASDDLDHWRSVSSGAQIVSLHYAGQAFVRNEVPITPTHASFLRLIWSRAPGLPMITTVDAIPWATEEPLERLSFEVTGAPTQREGEFDFDLGASLPVEQVNLLLPERNSVLRAEFLVPVSGSRNWRTVSEAQIYDLVVPDSGDLANAPISVPRTRERHWRVRIGEAGGGVGHGLPRLEVMWTPSEVLFLARGNGPFKLLYGNVEAPALALAPDAILNPAGVEDGSRGSLRPGRATLDAGRLLGGPDRLRPAAPPTDWKRWILWSVLVLGVGVLALMASKLFKSMGEKT